MRKFTRKVTKVFTNVPKQTKMACAIVAGGAMTVASTTNAFAVYELPASVTAGFSDAGAAILVIIAAGVTATVGVIAASGGAKAGLKWIKGVFAKA